MKIWNSLQTFDNSQNNFLRCCNSPNINQYECVHNPQPIHLSDSFLHAVEIKTERYSQYFKDEEIDGMILRYGSALTDRDITLVIVVDNSKLKTSQKEKLQNQGFTMPFQMPTKSS